MYGSTGGIAPVLVERISYHDGLLLSEVRFCPIKEAKFGKNSLTKIGLLP
jgi:hypothetical protein